MKPDGAASAQCVEDEALHEEVKKDNRIVAGWLLFYLERKRTYLKQRDEIIKSTPPPSLTAIPDQGYVSDSTGRKGDKLAKLRDTERWLALVEEIERRLPQKLQIILKLRRECKFAKWGNRWIIYVQRRYAEEIAAITGKAEDDVWVGDASVKEWWRQVVEYSCRLAGKRGLLD